jgi:NTP pyrophosphatase (non-canonical NTP hydrolase)
VTSIRKPLRDGIGLELGQALKVLRNFMKKLEKKILKYLKERNWHSLKPVDIAKSIIIEGAELLELFQWESLPLEEVKKNKAKMEDIKNELADVLIYSIEMSVLLGLDLEKVVLKKLAYVKKKYPAKIMRSRKEEAGTESEYWRIKRMYRNKK